MLWYKPYELRMVPCLTVQNTYTKLRKGSKKAVVVVRNNTAYLQTLQKKTPVARAVAASPVPEPPEGEQLLEGADESHDSHTPRLTVRQRHGKLFDELDLSGLDSWTPQLADAACCFLTEYYDMFSLDPTELGCTHSMKHMIKSLMTLPLRNSLDEFPLCWWRRLGVTCKKCWNLGPSDPARVLGAMQWNWCGRRMVAYSSVSTSAT